MKCRLIASILFIFLVFIACDKDEYPGINDFVVAFQNPSEQFLGEESVKEINIVFSQPAPETGQIIVQFTSENLSYGEEGQFITEPHADGNLVQLPVQKGDTGASFKVFKQTEVLPGEIKEILFSVSSVQMPSLNAYTQGNTEMLLSFSQSASIGGTMNPDVGGPNEPNQVYVNLRSKLETKIRRDVWDFGFYSGEAFHVRLNSSLYMFAAALESTDIDAIGEADVSGLKPNMNFLVEGSDQYVDHPDGDLNKLAIKPISAHDAENPVYLVKMGNEIGTDTPSPGGVAVAGADRGWKKIRILQRGNEYLLQYADVNSTTHTEVSIPKNPGFNFNFFSLSTESIVNVEPAQDEWDLNFTVAIEIEELPGAGNTAYGYSDYVATNKLGNVKAYRVYTSDIGYSNFGLADINEANFSEDPRTIGASWRNTLPPDRGIFTNIFYVIKDSDGNYYKLRFTALENQNGVRGYPEFEYKLLK